MEDTNVGIYKCLVQKHEKKHKFEDNVKILFP